MKNFLRRELRGKLRIWLSWLFLPFILLSVHKFPDLNGLVVLFAGAALRMWASGHLDKEGRLSVTGPYRFSRNPLYLGSILIAIAVPISQGLWILATLLGLISFFVHLPIIQAEEAVLRVKFGGEYQEYCARVPRFFSFSWYFADPKRRGRFNWFFFRRNKGWEPLVVAAALSLGIFIILGSHASEAFAKVPLPEPVHFILRSEVNL